MKHTHTKDVRYLSALILVIFIIGTLSSLSLLPSFAGEPPFMDDDAYMMTDDKRIELYLASDNVFASKEEKLAAMDERVTVGDYTLFVDTTTGEVAVKNKKTGQILMTNPYDVAKLDDSSVVTKRELMNQLQVTFCNVKDNQETTFGSFTDSAVRQQITVKNIKNGLRVEYTLGRESTKQLVPGLIEYERYKTLIYQPAFENCVTQLDYEAEVAAGETRPIEELRKEQYNYYIGSCYQTVIDELNLVNHKEIGVFAEDLTPPTSTINSWKNKYKDTLIFESAGITDYNKDGAIDKLVVVVLKETATELEVNRIETAIKQYTTYSYEDLTYDTTLTGYVSKDSNPALFRMALEYTLTADSADGKVAGGLEVRLPANSIRFNEDLYRLISVDVLPYFGASANDFEGYTFVPDGSGTIVRNEEIVKDGRGDFYIRGQIYGPDFAYHNITKYYNGKNQIMHLPVFGVVQNTITVTDNTANQIGYIWKQETLDQKYSKYDRIMLDAVDADGKLITTLEDYLAQFKVNEATGDVIRVGDALWESPDYVGVIQIGSLENPLEFYNQFVEKNEVPYIELINFYLMKEVVDADGKVVTYQGQPVYVYVNEAGEVVDAENRVEGLLKIKEQLWYNGAPAYYESDVPMDPNATVTPETTAPAEGEETPESTAAPEGEETPEEGEEEEEKEEIKMYNDISKVTETYDWPAFEEIEQEVSEGYFAIITEGDALCNITSAHGGMDAATMKGGKHKYNSVYISVFPRPQDTYRLADAISVSNDSTEWIVVSDRKYTGSYRIQYTMLSDATYVENGKIKENIYKANYVEMANVYRDYLQRTGVLDTEFRTDFDDDIPLYLEAFGMTTSMEVVATIPVMADVALTSFNDLKAIYEELSAGVKDEDNNLLGKIDNINFRLTGFALGGLYSYAPSELKFEDVVGGNKGYTSIVKYAKEVSATEGKNLGIFPDFDFANVERVGLFDEFSSIDDSARTIDDRYASKREYSATYQSFSPVGSITVSPSVYKRLFNVFAKEMKSLGGVSGLSVGSLGTDLNSDFDTDEPYNREDSKYFTTEILAEMAEKYGNVMINGGNAYALPYVDHIMNMPLTSTGFARASTAIPFMGMVLHGYMSYTGTATGMASDINKEVLKMIENGASPYFTIANGNESVLKEDPNFSKYYAISYENSKETIVKKYTILNEALGDVQAASITDHRFLTGVRSLGANELAELDAILAIAATEAGYTEAKNAALKAYNNRKALFERHNPGEVFTEVFEETYPWFVEDYTAENAEEVTKAYLAQLEKEFTEAIDREIAGNKIVLVEYTRKNGTKKVFVLNYEAYEVTVTLDNGDAVTIAPNDFAVISK
ncbi:MAG: hypothetical protein IJD35_07250 [Clostridia bacterium]|nr:hypothetical protein [Clostridia bacterium]